MSRKESSAEGVVTNIDDVIGDSHLQNQKVKGERGKFRMRKRPHQAEQARSHDLLATSESTEEHGRRSTSLPPSHQSGVQELRLQFESLSSSPTPPVSPMDDGDMTHLTQSHSNHKPPGTETEAGNGTRMGRRNSNGNSDSGRESMITESESIQPTA